jgi:thymidylate synthase ThyX
LRLLEDGDKLSFDVITYTNQKYGAYWARISAEFDERKYLDKDYATMVIRGAKRQCQLVGHRTGASEHLPWLPSRAQEHSG